MEMAVDQTGNSYQLSATSMDGGGLLSKIGPSGEMIWQEPIPGLSSNSAMVLAPSGAVHIASRSDIGFYIARYGPDSELQWSVDHDFGSALCAVRDMAIGHGGNVLVTGASYGITGYDAATVSYDSLGNLLWAAEYDHDPSSFGDHGLAVDVDLNGNTYVTGSSVDVELGTIVLLSYTPDGTLRWVRRTSPGYQSWANAVVVNQQQEIIIAGRYDGPAQGDFLCAAYDTSGNPLWTTIEDIAYEDRVIDMKLDGAGNIYILGKEHDSGSPDIALLALSPTGGFRWVRTYGSFSGSDSASDLAIGTNGHIHVTGHGPDSLNNDSWSTYILRYDPDGDLVWEGRYFSPQPWTQTTSSSIGSDGSDNVYVFGEQCSIPITCHLYVAKYGWSVPVDDVTPEGSNVVRYGHDASTITIDFTPIWAGPFKVVIMDVSGRILETNSTSDRTVTMHAEHLPPSVYMVRLTDASGRSVTNKLLCY